MITIKSIRELKGMQASGHLLATMFEGLRDVIKPGISTWEIEEFCQDFVKVVVVVVFQNKVLKATNMVLVFQLMMKLLTKPQEKMRILKEGDIVKVDRYLQLEWL